MSRIRIAAYEQNRLDARIVAEVRKHYLFEHSPILGQHGSGHTQAVAHQTVDSAANDTGCKPALREQSDDLLPSTRPTSRVGIQRAGRLYGTACRAVTGHRGELQSMSSVSYVQVGSLLRFEESRSSDTVESLASDSPTGCPFAIQ